jgi:hypothetical protein
VFPLKKQTYVVSIEKKDGTMAFLRLTGAGAGSSAVSGLTSDAGLARQFDIDTPKEEIISWVDKAKSGMSRIAYLDSIRVMVFETNLTEISKDDIEWRTVLQRHAVGKLMRMEIEALGLEKYEIERRLAKD